MVPLPTPSVLQRCLRRSLDDSPAARAFIAQLPLKVTLKDYASTEKIADLPRKLPSHVPTGAVVHTCTLYGTRKTTSIKAWFARRGDT
jgi:hypothetical protein